MCMAISVSFAICTNLFWRDQKLTSQRRVFADRLPFLFLNWNLHVWNSQLDALFGRRFTYYLLCVGTAIYICALYFIPGLTLSFNGHNVFRCIFLWFFFSIFLIIFLLRFIIINFSPVDFILFHPTFQLTFLSIVW